MSGGRAVGLKRGYYMGWGVSVAQNHHVDSGWKEFPHGDVGRNVEMVAERTKWASV